MKILIILTLIIISNNIFSEINIISECNDSVTYRVVEYLNNKKIGSNFQIIRNEKNEIVGFGDTNNKNENYLFVKSFASSSYSQMNLYTSSDRSIVSDYEVPTCKIKSIKESDLNSF